MVGFAESIDYLYLRNKGTDDHGGSIDSFAYILDENFNGDPNYVKLGYADVAGLPVSSKEYRNKMDAHRDEVKELFKDRGDIRLEENKDEIQDAIQEGEDEIAQAKRDIEDARKQLQDAKAELDAGREDLKEGESAFARAIRKGEQKLNSYVKKLEKGKRELAANQKKLREGQREIDEGHFLLRKNQEDYNKGFADYREGLNKYNIALREIEEKSQLLKDSEAQIAEGYDKIESESAKLRKGQAALDDAKAQLYASGRQLDQAENKLITSKHQLDQLEASIGADRAQLRQLGEAKAGLEAALQGSPIPGLKQEKAQKEQRLKDVNAAIGSKSAAIQSLRAEIDLLDPETEGDIIAAKNAEIAALNSEISGLQGEASQLQGEIAAIDAMLNDPNLVGEQQKILAQIEEININMGKLQGGISIKEEKLAEGRAALKQGQMEYEQGRYEYAKGQSKIREQEMQLAAAYDLLNSERAKLRAGEAELREARIQLEAGKNELNLNKDKLDKVGTQLKDAEKQLRDAEAKLAGSEATLNRGYKQLREGQAEIARGESELAKGRRTLEDERIRGERKLDDARSKLAQGEADYLEGQREFDEKSQEADEEIKKGEQDIEKAEDILNIIRRPSYKILPIHEDFNTHMHIENSKNIDNLAKIFPVFFFAIAMLLSSTAMNRMVEEQRGQIGTYKALGYGNGDIAKKYLVYGMVAAFFGGIIGVLMGNYFLSPLVSYAYSTGYIFDQNMIVHFYPLQAIVSVLLGLAATGLVALFTLKQSLKLNAAQLMRPKAPAKGNRILLERITPLWKRLTFLQKVTARNIFRYKKRMLMTVIGVLGCTALLVLGFGIGTSINGLGEKQFNELTRFDSIILYEEKLDPADYTKYREEISQDENLQAVVSAHINNLTIPNEKGQDQQVILITPEDPKTLDQIITLRDRKTGAPEKLTNDGAIITEKLADLYGVKPGDTLKVIDESDHTYDVKIANITEGYAGHYMYMTSETYEHYFGEAYRNNGDMVRFKSGVDGSPLEDYLSNKSVLAVRNLSEDQVYMDALTSNMQLIVMVIVLASTTLAMVVLFNLTEINIAERKRELSTIKVLGFYPREVTAYVYRETGLLTFIGIFIGLFVGKLLHYVVMSMVVPDHAMLDPRLHVMNFVIPTGITLIISFIVLLIVHRKLQRIDMVEALKGVE